MPYEPPWVLAIAADLLGTLLAWALTVPLHRFKEMRPKTPRDVSNEAGLDIRAVMRHARCPSCRHDFAASDVVPFLSWVKGCPSCGRRMPATVWVPQAVLGPIAVLTVLTTSSPWIALPYLWLCVVVVAMAVVDARIWLIPWWMPWLGSSVGLALIAVASIALDEPGAILDALAGGAGAFLFFFALWFLAPGKLGFGDVRLAAMLGLMLGWLHPVLPIYGLLIGSILGVVVGVVSMLKHAGNRFAFGPALGAGALLAVWFSDALLGRS
jgi:prepilin signal peptidase PulO-like enzyme (type II secretory pathway)